MNSLQSSSDSGAWRSSRYFHDAGPLADPDAAEVVGSHVDSDVFATSRRVVAKVYLKLDGLLLHNVRRQHTLYAPRS